MAVIPSTSRHRLIFILSWLPIWLIGAVSLVSSSGCRGCLRDDTEQLSREELEKKAREQKEALELKPLRTLPADSDIAITTAKAGHWVETIRQVKSNREDLQVIASGDVMRGPDKVLNIPHTNITTEFTRPTVLPKGQSKTIDLQYFVPTTSIAVDPNNPVSTVLRLRSSLLSRSLLTPLVQEPFSAAELGFGEFLLTVVSPKPQEYAFLSATDLVLWRGTDLMLEERLRCFRVVLCGSKDGKIELPTSMLTMTMMSILVWDDLAPDDLSEDQKTALLDWLHWGGQIVISGPGSWSRLQNSFLSPYLPVRSAEAAELGTEDFAPLNHWVVKDVSGQAEEPLSIVGSKMPGLKMTLAEQGSWLPHTDQLVAERAVGRGRIVVTGFPLREQRLYRWKYFSSFLSTGILRRPAREVQSSTAENSVIQNWAPPYRGDEKNPLFNTNLRIATRDIRLNAQSSETAEEFARLSEKELQNRISRPDALIQPELGQPVPALSRYKDDSLEAVQWAQNGAAWSDTSGFAFSAISTLRQAAGIVLPSRTTIMILIGSYLFILVPLNWLFFRVIGRLELAWVAAPIMALLGVLIVTRVARLDIGFARRTTEIGLLELHGEYPRAHLTNYVALYTSLSTPYALEFPERGSVVLPLGNVAQGARRSGTGNKVIQAKYGTSAGMRLEPVTVYSNSTEMLHAEQMVKLPGGLLYGIPDSSTSEAANSAAIKNTTGLELKSCCLLRKKENGQIQFAWLGDMLDENSRTAKFVDADLSAPWEQWDRNVVTRHPKKRSGQDDETEPTDEGSEAKANELLMGDLLSELLTSVPLVNGQVRLFAYTDARPGKMQSEPGDGRLDTRSILMAHLRPATWTEITRDKQVLGRVPNAAEPPEPKDIATDEPAS